MQSNTFVVVCDVQLAAELDTLVGAEGLKIGTRPIIGPLPQDVRVWNEKEQHHAHGRKGLFISLGRDGEAQVLVAPDGLTSTLKKLYDTEIAYSFNEVAAIAEKTGSPVCSRQTAYAFLERLAQDNPGVDVGSIPMALHPVKGLGEFFGMPTELSDAVFVPKPSWGKKSTGRGTSKDLLFKNGKVRLDCYKNDLEVVCGIEGSKAPEWYLKQSPDLKFGAMRQAIGNLSLEAFQRCVLATFATETEAEAFALAHIAKRRLELGLID